MAELTDIEEHHLNRRLGAKFMAWAMLERYRAANGQKLSSAERLRTKLREVKRLRKADIPREDRTVSGKTTPCSEPLDFRIDSQTFCLIALSMTDGFMAETMS